MGRGGRWFSLASVGFCLAVLRNLLLQQNEETLELITQIVVSDPLNFRKTSDLRFQKLHRKIQISGFSGNDRFAVQGSHILMTIIGCPLEHSPKR